MQHYAHSDIPRFLKNSIHNTRRLYESVYSAPPQVHWQIQSISDLAGDFLSSAGSALILEGQREAEVVLSLMPDTVPEVEELYVVHLTAVEGGATLDANPNRTSTRIRFVVMPLLYSVDGQGFHLLLYNVAELCKIFCIRCIRMTTSSYASLKTSFSSHFQVLILHHLLKEPGG